MGRPKGSKNLDHSAKEFVARVETLLKKSGNKNTENLERLACRFITSTGKNLATGATVWRSLMAYKYGQPKESSETTHKLQIEMKVEDADALIRSYFISAGTGSDPASESDQMQAAQQDRKLLPS